MNGFNTIALPKTLVLRFAFDAALTAVATYKRAEFDLAQPIRSRTATAIHQEVLAANALAASLSRRVR